MVAFASAMNKANIKKKINLFVLACALDITKLIICCVYKNVLVIT